MTVQEDRQFQAMALLELTEAQQRFNLVKEKATQFGNVFQRLGATMKAEPDNIATESYEEYLDYKRLRELIADLVEAKLAVQEAKEKCSKLGRPAA